MAALYPPFEEAPALCRLRESAMRLAGSDLTIAIAGEPGTGRRTLAEYLNTARTELFGGTMASIEASAIGAQSIEQVLRTPTGTIRNVVVYDRELLSKEQRVELSAGISSRRIRVIVVDTTREADSASGRPDRVADPIDRHVGETIVKLPPLRERSDDLKNWADLFLLRSAQRLGIRPPTLSGKALMAIRHHRWPGNLIELDAVLSRAACLTAKAVLDPSDLGLESVADGTPVFLPLSDAADAFKADYIARALAHFGGNRSQTARALGVDARTIFRFLAKNGGGKTGDDE